MLVATTINNTIAILHRLPQVSSCVSLFLFLFLHEYNSTMKNTLNDAFQQDAML